LKRKTGRVTDMFVVFAAAAAAAAAAGGDDDDRGKGKVVPVIFLTDNYAMKAYWGVEV
jgi:hypothetical protein